MPRRNILLRVMLWSLGLAAATGVLTVFVQGGNFMWRVIATEIGAAVACGLMLPCMTLIDRARTREAGLLGMTAIVAEFCLALLLIWDVPRALGGRRWHEQVALTLVLLGSASLVSMPLLWVKHQPAFAVAARVGLSVVVCSTCIFMFAIVSLGTSWHFGVTEYYNQSGWAVFAIGSMISMSLMGVGVAPRRPWRWAGVAAALAALVLWLLGIWYGPGGDRTFALFAGLLVGSAAVAYSMACLMVPLTASQQLFRNVLIAAAVLTAVFIQLLVMSGRDLILVLDDRLMERCVAAGGIVTGCGTLALMVLARLNRRIDVASGGEALTDIVVICPRCRKKQSLAIGDAACAACGLRISTRVEEPRCPICDYLLIGLTSDRCPECGTAITAGYPTNSTPV